MYTIIVCHDKLVSRIHVVKLILLLKSCKTEARKGTRTKTKLQNLLKLAVQYVGVILNQG